MANRSYIYSIEFDRTLAKRKENEKICGLSEYPYEIPLSYKILVSQNPQISESIIWDYKHPIAIQGDFNLGKKRLFDFLEKLSEKNIFDKHELQIQINKTNEFLNDRKRDLKFVILENGEIYALNDEALEEQNKNLFNNEIVDIENLIQKYFSVFQERKNSIDKLKEKLMELQKPKRFFNTIFSKQNKAIDTQNIEKNIQKTETEMWNMLGINFWENILYFSF